MKKIGINEFLSLAISHPIVDVRSPGEYCHAHIPGAYSLPLFSDEERKIIGTLYKLQSREHAIKKGLEFFGVKMKEMVEEAEKIISSCKSLTNAADNSQQNGCATILVHCWRGGMRSAGVAWLLDLYGFKVCTLAGGYKAYRNWVLQQFVQPYPFKMLGGYTGSGKTEVIGELKRMGHSTIDLEGMACHKGSAFGALGEAPQPTQEMFENELALKLQSASENLPQDGHIWLEDESRRIGAVNIPDALWGAIRRAPLYFLDVPFEERLDHITEEYGQFDKPRLVSCILRIQKRLGGKETKDAVNFLKEGDYRACFRILLCYYDKFYTKDIDNRGRISIPPKNENKLIRYGAWLQWRASWRVDQKGSVHFPGLKMKKIICDRVDAIENCRKLINIEK